MTQRRDLRHADRVRAAICVALADADSALTVGELVVALRVLGITLGPRPNKVVADAVRWEIGRRHVRRVARGKFAVDRLPPSTEYYMRVRVARYAADPTQPYSRPDNYGRAFAGDDPAADDEPRPIDPSL